jgi:hypothetical protein
VSYSPCDTDSNLIVCSEPDTAEHFELLLRALLIRIDNPAVIILGHFAPQYQDAHGFGGPEVTHAALAQFYDVPHVRYVRTLAFSLSPKVLLDMID